MKNFLPVSKIKLLLGTITVFLGFYVTSFITLQIPYNPSNFFKEYLASLVDENHTITAERGNFFFSRGLSKNANVTAVNKNLSGLSSSQFSFGEAPLEDITINTNAPLVIDFTFSNDNTCAGEVIQFTNAVTGIGPFQFQWNFGDGTTSEEENPAHSYAIVGEGAINYNVSLEVTDASGSSSTLVKSVTVKKKPTVSFFSGTNSFVNCSTNSTDTDFNLELFLDTASSSDDIASYTIDWGDGSAPLNLTEFPSMGYTHTYATGIFSLVISVTNTNGCSNEVSYDISNGSNPGGAFESSGSTTGLCFPTEVLTFKIGGLWGLNPINTTYLVDFGDGNAQSFTQQELEDSPYFNSADPSASNGFEVYHSYTTGSCSEENGEFIASLTIINDCGDTQWTIDSINVLEPSQPLFELPSDIGCVNVPIEFDNQSFVGTALDCTESARFMWDFGDGSPVVNTPFSSEPGNQSHTYTEPGNYTISLSVFGVCGTNTFQQQICIEPEMLLASFEVDTLAGCAPLSVSAQNTIDESELCSAPSYNWTVDYIPANCETSGDWEFINGTDENSENPAFNFKNSGKYKLTQYIITNCETTPVEKIIEVKKPPEASIAVIDDFCGTALMNPVGNVNQCTENASEVSYNWTFVGGVPATSNTANPGDIAYDTPGVYEVTLQVSNSCGTSNIAKQTFEIFEEPLVTNTDITQEICSGQSTAEIVLASSMPNSSFSWTATASDGISGFMSNGEGTTIPSELLMSTRNTPGTVVYAVTPKTNECDGFVKEFTVTVNPTPLFTSQPEDSEVCVTGTPTTLEVTFTNGTGMPGYQWYVNTTDDKIGGNLIVGATESSYDPPANIPGDWFYYVVISFDTGGCNEISSETARVRVQPQLTIDNAPNSQTICLGGSVSALEVSHTGGTGTSSYQWYYNTTNSNTGGTSITGATNASYTPAGFDSVEDLYYYVTITLDGDGCNTITSDVYTISVVSKPSIVTQPIVSQELCQGAVPADLSVVATGGTSASYAYQWFQNSSNSIVGGTPIDGANAPTYSPSSSNVGTFYYYVVVLQNASACSVVSSISELKVKPIPVVTQQPESSEVCLNGTPTTLEVVYANGTGVPSYQWYVNTTDSAVGASPITGATASSYSPIADIQGDFFYYVVISFDAGGCNDISSDSAMVRVQPQLTIDATVNDQTICIGGSASPLDVTYTGGTGSPSYQWYSNTSNSNTGGTSIAGATSASYTPTDFTSLEDLYYYVTISLDGVGCNTITSDVYTISVVSKPTIATQPLASQELCQGVVASDLSVAATGGTSAAYAYQWFQNTSNSTSNGVAITGATTATFTPNTTSVGTSYYYVVVSQPESACSVVSEVSQLIVKSAPVVTKQPESSEVCLNGTPTTLEVVYVNGTGVPSYQWYVNTIDGTVGASPITGATASSYSPIADAQGDLFYYVVISFSAGGCNEISSDSAMVRAQPQLTIEPTVNDQIICVGGAASSLDVTYTGGTGTPSYQWYSNASNSNTGGTIITGATSASYTPTNFTSVEDLYYYVTISLDGAGCNTITSDVYTISVVSKPIIATQPLASQELCQGAVAADLSAAVTGGTSATYAYQWFQNTSNSTANGVAITGATTSTFTPNTTSVGTFYYYVVVSQSESACSVVSEVSQLIVKSAPVITKQPESSEVCLNGTPTTLEMVYANGAGVTSYQWYVNTTDSTIGANPITGATASSYSPIADLPGDLFYYVVISFDASGCNEIYSDSAMVRVQPQLTFDGIASDQIICVGGSASPLDVIYTGGTGSPSYQWYSNTSNSNTGGTSIAGATSASYTPTNFTNVEELYYYVTISLDGVGCNTMTSDVYTISVVPKPTIAAQPLASQELCQGAVASDLSVAATGGTSAAYVYQWFQNTSNSTSNGVAITGATSSTFTPNTNSIGTSYYYAVVSQPESACAVVSEVSQLIVKSAPMITKQPESSEVCLNETPTTLEVTYASGAGLPNYQWYVNTTNSAVGANPITGAISSSYVPTTDVVGDLFYYVVISFDSGGCAEIISDFAQVKVNQFPVIASASIIINSGATFDFDPSSVLGNVVPNNTKYTWSAPLISPNNSIVGGSSMSIPQNTISQTLDNTGTTSAVALYTVTPTNLNCVGDSFQLEVIVKATINPNAVVIDATCFESNDGGITTNITGGTPFNTGAPYLIRWTGPNGFESTDANLSNLAAGTYVLTVEDKDGTIFTSSYTITQPPLLNIITELEKNITCSRGNDGAIEVTLQGGSFPYIYNWTSLDGSGLVAGEKNQNNLTAGTYRLEVVDQNSCVVTQEYTLSEPNALTVQVANIQDVLCFGDATGSIAVDVVGGNMGYTYRWTGPNSFSSDAKDIDNLFFGTYEFTVTDALGCSTQTIVSIEESPELKLAITKSDVKCNGDANGSIDVAVIGGKAPYEIAWSNFANGFSQNDITAGTYVATITDANKCEVEAEIIIEEPNFSIETQVMPISCNGANDGAIDIRLTGGTAPISVVWSDDASSGLQRNNLEAGTYTVLIQDSNTEQCPIERTFVILNPPVLDVSSVVIDAVDCDLPNSGSIDLTVAGGVAPYTFLWSNGSTEEDLLNISQGDYAVEIVDANGCSVSKQFSIFRQAPLAITFEEETLTNCDLNIIEKKVVPSVTGGFLPYTYEWSDGNTSGVNNEILTVDQSGSYVLTVTDDKGCTESKVFITEVPEIGGITAFDYTAFSLSNFGLVSIEDPIQFNNISTGDYVSLTWDFGDGTILDNDENPVHTYNEVGSFSVVLSVEYAEGCIKTYEIVLEVTTGFVVIAPTGFTPNGDGYNETMRPACKGFKHVQMYIYDTWGAQIYFEEGSELKGWNGMIGNKPAENGNYVMVVKGVTFYDKEVTNSSPITVLK